MKKGLLVCLLLACIFCFTGCGSKEMAIDTDKRDIVIHDDSFGTTTFKLKYTNDYALTYNYDDKYVLLEIDSVWDNLYIRLQHASINYASYNSDKTSRARSKGFQTYYWNSYEGYIYDADKNGLKFIIKLGNTKAIIGEILPYNSSLPNVLETFNSDNFQSLLDSITFESE